MTMSRTLTPGQVKRFYDRFGRLQDGQVFYGGRALDALERHGRFEESRRVIEFGCGTGAFARRLLKTRLPPEARYLGLDISETMVRIARRRLETWADLAEVRLTAGEIHLPATNGSADRVVANYVLDLMSKGAILGFLTDTHRALEPGGLLWVASLTHGATPLARLIARFWARVQAWRPAATGGCRPILITDYLARAWWHIDHHEVVTQCAISSEVLVARKGGG